MTINIISNPVDLICVCQGAWLGAAYTSLHQDKVLRYVNFAGPINTQTGQFNLIENYMKIPGIVLFHKWIVELNQGIQKGSLQHTAFAMTNPYMNYMGLYGNLFAATFAHDTKKIIKAERDLSWNIDFQDLHGTWFTQCLQHHFYKNELYEGTWQIGEYIANLANITCPIYLYSGEDDDITHTQQVHDMAKKVSTHINQIIKRCFKKSGHTAVFCRKKNIQQFIKDFYYRGI